MTNLPLGHFAPCWFCWDVSQWPVGSFSHLCQLILVMFFQALQPHSLLSVHEMWTSKILSSFLEVYPYSVSSSHGLSAHSLKEVFWSPCWGQVLWILIQGQGNLKYIMYTHIHIYLCKHLLCQPAVFVRKLLTDLDIEELFKSAS